MLPMLNRTGVIVRAKEPFLAWAVEVFKNEEDPPSRDDVEATFVRREPRAYLIAYTETDIGLETAVRESFEQVFEAELESWCTDEDLWPDTSDWAVFKDWFDWILIDGIFDTLEDEPLLEVD